MACARRDATRREAPCNRNRARDRARARDRGRGDETIETPVVDAIDIDVRTPTHPWDRGRIFPSDIHSAIHDGAHHSGCYFCRPVEGSLNRARFVDVESNPRAGSGLAGS